MPTRDRPLYAVFIDADNISPKHAAPILKEISSFAEPALRRVYGDWSSPQLQSWTETVRALGLVAHQQSANTKGKNASDIGLVIDAMDILHKGRFEGFVIVSSDSDFTALANRIREEGLAVIGIGQSKTPDSLRNVCNRFILIENIVDELPTRDASTAPKAGAKEATGKHPATDAVPLILAAMNKIEQDGEWYRLGELGSRISAARSDFDTRTYGHAKLSELVKSLKQFTTRRSSKNDTQIEVKRLK